MKKTFFVLAVLALVIIGGTFAYKKYFADPGAKLTDTKPKNSFAWGVTTSCYNLDGYKGETVTKTINTLNKLGVNTVRIFLERNITLEPFSIKYDEKSNDDFIGQLNQDNKDIVLILDGDIIKSSDMPKFDQEKAGYQIGSYAAKRYKGKVKYYQLANEVTGTVAKPADPDFKGATFKDNYGLEYSQSRYNSVLNWLKGMQRGVRENDPDAKIVISGHWILFSVVDKLIADGIDPDVIGWAWYSDDGLDITARQAQAQTPDPINLAAKLNSYGKPVWIIETNSKYGSFNEQKNEVDENYQADFFKNFIPKVMATNQVDGIFVYNLFDIPTSSDKRPENQAHWGLVGVSKNKDGSVAFKPKKAFDIYADEIKTYSN